MQLASRPTNPLLSPPNRPSLQRPCTAVAAAFRRIALHCIASRTVRCSGVAGHVVETGQLRLVHDTATDECFDAAVDSPASEGTAAQPVRNLYAAPIRTSRGKTVGVVQLHNKATPHS